MLIAVFLFLLFLAIGVGFLFLAFNKHSRRKMAEQYWLWEFVKNAEDEEHVEAMTMLGPLLAGILIISGAVAVFLIWLLA